MSLHSPPPLCPNLRRPSRSIRSKSFRWSSALARSRRWTVFRWSCAAANASGLLGPNGAGKSTLIRCIVGRVIPDAGRVAVFGAPAGSPQARAALGWVPQELALYPRLTCQENLAAFGRYHGLSGGKLKESVAWCLDWAALADRAGDLAEEPLRRHEAAAQHGGGNHPSASRGADGRADGRRRSAIAQPHLRDDRSAARRGRRDHLHHALHGRGGAALRPHRHHRSRAHHRPGHQGRAGPDAFASRSQVVARFAGHRAESPPGSAARRAGMVDGTAEFTIEHPPRLPACWRTPPTPAWN